MSDLGQFKDDVLQYLRAEDYTVAEVNLVLMDVIKHINTLEMEAENGINQQTET